MFQRKFIGSVICGLGLISPVVAVHAQDVPGIEICTAEKTMERRTSCLQSNVDFLMKSIGKVQSDSALKLDAANRQIETLKASLVTLQKSIDDLKSAQAKPAAAETKPAKDALVKEAPVKDGAK